jgi:hypothetical protein
MTIEILIAICSLIVTLLGTPVAVLVSLLVFRAVTQWRIAALETRVTELERDKAEWRTSLQGVRDEINALRVALAKRSPKESDT